MHRALILAFSFVLPTVILRLYARFFRYRNVKHRNSVLTPLNRSANTRILGYFHPYCNAGGGGERVLWAAIASAQRSEPDVLHVVYSGDVDASKEEIISKVQSRFNISLDPSKLHFVFLFSRRLVEDRTWPYFTLLGQSLGSMYLVWEAIASLIPDLYIDTMGYAFTFHVVSFLGAIPCAAYVHYPTISTKMLERVKSRQHGHTNRNIISASPFLSHGKLLYYRIFMFYYSLSLRSAAFLMVNSTWTKRHVDEIVHHHDPFLNVVTFFPHLLLFQDVPFGRGIPEPRIVYPPCDTHDLVTFPLEPRESIILSVAQFRPEKDHAVQLNAFSRMLSNSTQLQNGEKAVKLVLVGGSRNEGDTARIKDLEKLARELGIQESVEFVINASYSTVLNWLSRASVGLSTMIDEHFGINVVELMAAGCIPVAHASGGPLEDIIVPLDGQSTGFHATSSESFADALEKALSLPHDQALALRKRARDLAVQKFSEEEFVKGWNRTPWRSLLFSRRP